MWNIQDEQFEKHVLCDSHSRWKVQFCHVFHLLCDKNWVTKNVYQNGHFLGSFKFIPQSSEKQSGLMPKEKLLYLGSQFSMQNTASQVDLMRRKGVYPCLYTDTFNNFCDWKLSAEKVLEKHTRRQRNYFFRQKLEACKSFTAWVWLQNAERIPRF